LSKKVSKKRPPGECFSPPSENIENLSKVVPTQHSWSGNTYGDFADFQMFSDSRHRWLARQELPARQILANLSRKNRIVSQKQSALARKYVGVREWLVRSLPGGRQGSIYIFLNFLVLFVSSQKVQ